MPVACRDCEAGVSAIAGRGYASAPRERAFPTTTRARVGYAGSHRHCIGAPGFEPGTSPTRTVRATRLRHAPRRTSIPQRGGRAAPVRCTRGHPDGDHRLPRRAARLGVLRRLRPQRPAGPRARRGRRRSSPACRPRRAVRAGRRRRRRRGARPPRPVLEGRAARARPPRTARACGCCFAADVSLAYHLPLDAHPELGNNALLAARRSAPRAASRSPTTPAARSAWPRALPATASSPASCSPACARALTGREPLVFDAGPARVRPIGIVSGGGRRPRRRDRARARRLPHGRAVGAGR